MSHQNYRTIWACLAVVLVCTSVSFADSAAAVKVKYEGGDTEVDAIKEGNLLNTDIDDSGFKKFPAELSNLMFTRRGPFSDQPVTINASAPAEVYFLFGDGGGEIPVRKAAVAAGCKKIGPVSLKNGFGLIAYKMVLTMPKRFTLTGSGMYGIIVATKNLVLETDGKPSDEKASDSTSTVQANTVTDEETKPTAGPTTRIANPQASIKALEIFETETGLVLGQTSEVVLTVSRSDTPKLTVVEFPVSVGDQMRLSCDEALRYIRITYPNWYADSAEMTFEDKYTAHDGGSIGTAIGTMVLSVIQGFTIDPSVAITGDISANGKVRAIGGVSAKLRGAIDSKCTIAIVPLDNEPQLVDAAVYGGPGVLSDIQIIGVSNLEEAVAAARSDRSSKLSQAIKLFGEMQLVLSKSPSYLKSTLGIAKLNKVLELEPRHLSAKLLLAAAQGKLPKTLSLTASHYYTSVAAQTMLAVLTERNKTQDQIQIPSGTITTGLISLRKLKPLADVNVRPLIVSWIHFIQAWNDLQQKTGTARSLDNARQALLDEMTKENTNPELMQKMMKEGI